jgi:hypothetical protein
VAAVAAGGAIVLANLTADRQIVRIAGTEIELAPFELATIPT